MIWDKKVNEYVYIQDKKKTEDPSDDKRHTLKFLGLENEIFMLLFNKKPKLNMDLKVSDKHKKFPSKIKVDYHTNEERHYFDWKFEGDTNNIKASLENIIGKAKSNHSLNITFRVYDSPVPTFFRDLNGGQSIDNLLLKMIF